MTKVIAMTRYNLSDAKQRVGSFAEKLNDHLVKLLFFGNEKSSKHYIDKICSWVKAIHRIRVDLPSRSKLTASEINALLNEMESWESLNNSYLDNAKLIRSQAHNFTPQEIKNCWPYIESYFKIFYAEISAYLASDAEWNKDKIVACVRTLIKSIKVYVKSVR